MSQLEDGWIEGFPVDGDDYRAWAGKIAPPPHHRKWDEALQVAMDAVTADWSDGDQGEFTLTYRVRVTKRNPGWIDGYKVDPGG